MELAGSLLRAANLSAHPVRPARDDFAVLQDGDRFFAVPHALGPVYLRDPRVRQHPAIACAASPEELTDALDAIPRSAYVPEPVEIQGDYRVVMLADAYFALPPGTDDRAALRHWLEPDPSVLHAESLGELRRQIRERDAETRMTIHGLHRGFQVVTRGRETFGLPPHLLALDVRNPEVRCVPGVILADSADAVRAQIDARLDAVEIEYGGWVPAFIPFGNCGTHPQYSHIDEPPEGYRFVKSNKSLIEQAGGSPWRKRWLLTRRLTKIAAAAAKLFGRMLLNGVRLRTAFRFLLTREPLSQWLLPDDRELTLLPTVPYSYSQCPWMLEIEDPITLFYPYFHNGHTHDLAIREATIFHAVRSLIETPNCRGIITHIQATAEGLPKLFQNEALAKKIHHIPMGVQVPDARQRHEPSNTVQLLFTNSWHQGPVGFYPRGGLDVLEAFALLKPVHPQLHLVLRTKLPEDLPTRYRRIIDECGVQVIDKFLRPEEFEGLLTASHVYLLPAARIHIVSLLQAMSYGLVPLVSDGWGMTEYVDHERTGLVVKGRYGKVSWQDEIGLMREDYRPLWQTDAHVVQGMVDALSRLVDSHELRRTLGHAARNEVVHRFNRKNWNAGLKRALDAAVGASR